MSELICNAPFCENPKSCPKKHTYCGVHRWEREKYKVKAYKELLPLWAYKRCVTHGLLRLTQVILRKSGHHECKACVKIKYPYCPIKGKVYAKKYSSIHKNTRLKKRYGIDNEFYYALLLKQNSCCAICSINITDHQTKKGDGKRFAVDHCHDSGKVRGLLCYRCNMGLGYFKDSPEITQTAYKYLSDFIQSDY